MRFGQEVTTADQRWCEGADVRITALRPWLDRMMG
jgi:hypothetical protein